MKRKENDMQEDGQTARERKKQKVADSRTISVQEPSMSNATTNPVAGPSRMNSMQGLPGAIDVEKFAEARAYEIGSMEKAIKTAGSSSAHRVWQTLPRHLRRRAASHDIRRVPLKLRAKAKYEMDPPKEKAGKKLPKRGRLKRVSRAEEYLKRQRNKLWLETHIWHAKRMKMENMWGYRLAVQPTEKAFRPSHRASLHGSILHDASYYSTIELKGPEDILLTVLDSCTDPQDSSAASKRYTAGSRVCNTHFYQFKSYPYDLIGPVTVLWRPTLVPLPNEKNKKRKGKGKATPNSNERVTWLWCHPTIFNQAFATLQNAASHAIKEARTSRGIEAEVELADISSHLNMFEIMGPKSSQVIKGALSPVSDEREEFTKFWSSLADLQTSAALPRGLIVGCTVNDPRLKFPPKNAKPVHEDSHQKQGCSPTPSPIQAQSAIWEENVRSSLKVPRFKKKDLDKRQSENLVPGTPLKPTGADNRIPILLVQRSVESSASEDSEGIHGWTVVIPAGWSMAFFSSLVYTGTRVGGQRERRTQAFEAGTAYFPRDSPTTSVYDQMSKVHAVEAEDAWRRRPPAKRPNYVKLGTRSPWIADWRVVLGLEGRQVMNEWDFVPTQRESVSDKSNVRSWLLRGKETSDILLQLSQRLDVRAGLLDNVNTLRVKRGLPLLIASERDDLARGALVLVQLKMHSQGSPEDLAMIYPMLDKEVQSWLRRTTRPSDGAIVQEEPEHPEESPSPDIIFGYVTTGNFSLSRGEGCAIGAMPLLKLIKIQEQANSLALKSPMVKLRDRAGQHCRVAYVRVLNQ